MRTLRTAQPPGIRSTGGLHAPFVVKATGRNGSSDFVADLESFAARYGISDDDRRMIAAQLRAVVLRAREGCLKYSEKPAYPESVCEIRSQSGVLEARLNRTVGDEGQRLFVRLFFSEPEDFEIILLLGVLVKEGYPIGFIQQNRHARVCQHRGDEWLASQK